jgi:hypothetical protein
MSCTQEAVRFADELAITASDGLGEQLPSDEEVMHDENARHRAMMLVAEMPGWASYSEPLPDTGLFIFFRGVAGYLSRPCTHKSRLVSSRWVTAMPY